MDYIIPAASIIIGLIVVYVLVRMVLSRRKRAALTEKYQDAEIADRIMKKQFWQGMSDEQLLESLGKPVEFDEKVLKTKTKQTFKYEQTGANRFDTRIHLEDGIVVGWDLK